MEVALTEQLNLNHHRSYPIEHKDLAGGWEESFSPSVHKGQVNRASHVGTPTAPALETLVRRDIPENSSPYSSDNKKEKENMLHQ